MASKKETQEHLNKYMAETLLANERQVGGVHYTAHGRNDLQHWDIVDIFGLGYFEGQVTKYLFRWKSKNGVQDLYKAAHYLQKLIEIEEAKKQQ